MRLLITNDDGVDAPGLAALARAAESLGKRTIVAPHEHLSGCGHRVTTDKVIHLEGRGVDLWAIHGTPADCVRVGLFKIVPQADWILSGVNAGGNLGADVHISGTVAAVREAVLHGRRGIAVSQYRKRNLEVDLDRAVRWLTPLLADLMARPTEPGVFWNVNLPHLAPDDPDPKVVICPLEMGPLPLHFHEEETGLRYAGNYHGRVRQAGTDVDVCFQGNIAVTMLRAY